MVGDGQRTTQAVLEYKSWVIVLIVVLDSLIHTYLVLLCHPSITGPRPEGVEPLRLYCIAAVCPYRAPSGEYCLIDTVNSTSSDLYFLLFFRSFEPSRPLGTERDSQSSSSQAAANSPSKLPLDYWETVLDSPSQTAATAASQRPSERSERVNWRIPSPSSRLACGEVRRASWTQRPSTSSAIQRRGTKEGRLAASLTPV